METKGNMGFRREAAVSLLKVPEAQSELRPKDWLLLLRWLLLTLT